MKAKETFTLVNIKTGSHYDTNDEKFYGDNWERTQDTKEYLELLKSNNPEKFKDYTIEDNS